MSSPWPFAFLSITCFSSLASACQCVAGIQVCQEYWSVDAIFSGVVKAISKSSMDRELGGVKDTIEQHVVRIAIDKTYAGPSQPDEVNVVTGLGDPDCGYAFRIGSRYLVYAEVNKETKQLETGKCSLTKPFAQAAKDLEFINGLSKAPAVGRIYGRVLAASDAGNFVTAKPVAGATVHVTGSGGSFVAVSGTDGTYELNGLPPGTYQVKTSLRGYELLPNGGVEVHARGCAGHFLDLVPREK